MHDGGPLIAVSTRGRGRPRAVRAVVLGLAMNLACPAWAELAEPPPIGQPWPVDMQPVPAATPVLPAGPLTLATLSDFALRHHPSTRATWAAALADRAGIDAARALLRPTLTFDLPLAVSRQAAAADPSAAAGPAADGPLTVTRSVAPSLSLAWVLFDSGARASGVDAARWQAVASRLGYDRELQTVVSSVEQAYYALLGARELQASLQTSVTAAQASLDSAQARRRAGLATVAETAQAEASLAQARLQWVQAGTQARSAAGSLANAIGVPVTTPLPLADDAVAATESPGLRIDDLLATAQVSRADLIALGALVRQGEAQLAATEAQGRPSLILSAQAGRRWSSDGSSGSGASSQQIGLTLSIPISDGGLVRAQAQAARARIEQLAAQRELQRQAVELEVWQSYQQADGAQAAVESAMALLRSALVAEEAARERYRAGVGILLELLVAQSSAAQARVSLVQARLDGRLAMARLGYAVGAGSGAGLAGPRESR